MMYPGNINSNLSYNFQFGINQTTAFMTWKLNIYFLKCFIDIFKNRLKKWEIHIIAWFHIEGALHKAAYMQ